MDHRRIGQDAPLERTLDHTQLDHAWVRQGGDEMGVVYYTDIAGRLSVSSRESDPVPTAAAMLRDAIEVALR